MQVARLRSPDHAAGTDIAALARSFGMHRQTVRNHLLRRGVTLLSDSPALPETPIDRPVELYATKLSTIKLSIHSGSEPPPSAQR